MIIAAIAVALAGSAHAIETRVPIEAAAPALKPLAPLPTPLVPLQIPGVQASPEVPGVETKTEISAQTALQNAAGPAARPKADAPVSAEADIAGGRKTFDGWSLGSFESEGGGKTVYKSIEGGAGSPRVYAGGLALNESFDPLFAMKREQKRSEYFMWTRGHPPTQWTPTQSPLDADARDLARMINIAGEKSPTGKVELALHSFGTLVFQRLVQLRHEPEAAQALKHLADSRVALLHATTHFEGSERKAGPDFERMGMAARLFVDWLDAADAVADQWRAAARLNPLLAPSVSLWLSQWSAQRAQALAMASKGAADMMRQDLAEPWDPAYDSMRKDMVKALARDSRDPGWQEALMRRSNGMFRLDMTKADVQFIKRLGVALDFVHAAGDKLLNWASAKALFDLFGIKAPDDAPPPGAELSDRTGRARAKIVDGDHYFPLKRRAELAKLLDP